MQSVTSLEFVLYQVVMFGLPLILIGAIFWGPQLITNWERRQKYCSNSDGKRTQKKSEMTGHSGHESVITITRVSPAYADFDRPLSMQELHQLLHRYTPRRF